MRGQQKEFYLICKLLMIGLEDDKIQIKALVAQWQSIRLISERL